jgi:hypothetical protein
VQPSIDIQNLLLGLSGLPTDVQPAQNGGVLSEFDASMSSDVAQPLFRDVLGLLIDGQRLNPAQHMALPIVETGINEGATAVISSPKADSWFENILAAGLTSQSGGHHTIADNAAPETWLPVDSKAQAPIQNPLQSTMADQPVHSLMLTEAVSLAPGKYEVLDSRVDGGQIEMVIRSDSRDGQEITLRLPVEAIRGQIASTRNSHRVTINNEAPGQDLKSLLVNLKATTIEIKEVPPPDGKALPEIEIKLTTDSGGQANALKLQVSREDVQAKITTTIGRDIQSTYVKSEFIDTGTNEKSYDGFADQNQPRHAARTLVATSKPASQAPMDFSRVQLHVSTSNKVIEPLTITNSETASTGTNQSQSADIGTGPQVTQSARLVVPEHVASQLKPNGQSIMIRVEPDHLGPARLNLTLRGNVLTARVTVETPLAQAAVESSVDQLVDQLARAGIKVNQVQVAVDGGGLRNQFFDRQSIWPRPKMTQRTEIIDGTELEQPIAHVVSDPYAAQYVGREGVNVFA